MHTLKRIRKAGHDAKNVAKYINEASKVRIGCLQLEQQIKYGVPLLKVKGLTQKDAYLTLSVESQQKALKIVDEECERKNEWKPKELKKLAKIIEARLKDECV